jgi:hypothetical protein
MSKLYFLLPDEQTAAAVVVDLKTEGVPEDAIGIVARDQTSTGSLPAADAGETSDFKPAVAQGVVVGGGTGLLAGLAMAVVPGGLVVGGAALAGMALAGGAFGAWVSGMVGVSVPNREIAEFESAIEQGAFLMMVDVADEAREAIKQTVIGRHPKVVFGGQSEGPLSAVGY